MSTPTRRLIALLGAAALVVAGCGQTGPTISIPAGTSTSTVSSAATTSSGPTVHFVEHVVGSQAGDWPFSAQLASLRTNVNGLWGGAAHRQDETMLVLQVDITDEMPGQLPPIPQPNFACAGPGIRRLDTFSTYPTSGPIGDYGWDRGPGYGPDSLGYEVALGDGRPHMWDEEWAVPLGLDASRIKCGLEQHAAGSPSGDIQVQGSRKLN